MPFDDIVYVLHSYIHADDLITNCVGIHLLTEFQVMLFKVGRFNEIKLSGHEDWGFSSTVTFIILAKS